MTIEEEIKSTAESLVKAHNQPEESPKELLIKAIRESGPEAVREVLPQLSDSDCQLLKSTLESMSKAVEMDDEYQGSYIQGNVFKDTIIESDHVDDDQDEKLVKPEAAKHNHQGNSDPDGKDDHKVADPDSDGNPMKKSQEYALIAEFLEGGKSKEDALEHFGKSMSLDIMNQMVDFYMMEHERTHHTEELEFDMESEMYKSLHSLMEKGHSEMFMKGYGKAKGYDPDKMEKAMSYMDKMRQKDGEKMDKGHNSDMGEVSEKISKMNDSGAMVGNLSNPEEVQSADNLDDLQKEKTSAKKETPEAMELGDDNADAQKKVDDMTPMKKSEPIVWKGSNHLLKAKTLGRNHHFNVNDFIEGLQKSLSKSGEDSEASELPADLSTIIQLGGDMSRTESINKSGLMEQGELQGKPSNSPFTMDDMREVLHMTTKTMDSVLED